MVSNDTRGSLNQKELDDFRAMQEEMLNLSREYSRDRMSVWTEETQNLTENWTTFSREWQGNLEAMTSLAGDNFAKIAAQGEEASNLLSQSWGKSLGDISGGMADWGENFLQTLGKVAAGWMGAMGGGGSGSGGGWSSLLGSALGIGGWFHQGGVVTAHQGMVVPSGTLLSDEQLILAQTGEGILPREAMARLGEQNFEALRRGRFDLTPGGGAPRYDITIQVQSLDAAGVAGLDWDRLVQRHLLPALQKDADRRW
jgi:hypothetical protein